MDRGIYSASSGGLLSALRLDIVGNNLANVNTVGFKAQRLVSREQEFQDTLASTLPVSKLPETIGDHERTPGAIALSTKTDFTPGPIKETGNTFDVALRGENAFFAISAPEGEAYTRAGNFTLNESGALVTADGYPVLGDGGPIVLPPGPAEITSAGAVTVNGELIAKLRVVTFDDLTKLERTGSVRFVANGAQGSNIDADVVPGALEMPNISVVDSMVEMINANRAFEAYTKSVKTIDELNDRAIRNTRSVG